MVDGTRMDWMGCVVLVTVFVKAECRRDRGDWVVEKLGWDVDGDCTGRGGQRARLIGLIGEREWLEDDDDDDGYLWLATIIRLELEARPKDDSILDLLGLAEFPQIGRYWKGNTMEEQD